MKASNKVILLLSGGQDSCQCVEILKHQGFNVNALCISGKQKVEVAGAKKCAEFFQIPLKVVELSVFDELTWNPCKLIFRDTLMLFVTLYFCYKWRIRTVAVGIKIDDIHNPKLSWLKYFLKFTQTMGRLLRIHLILPLIPS